MRMNNTRASLPFLRRWKDSFNRQGEGRTGARSCRILLALNHLSYCNPCLLLVKNPASGTATAAEKTSAAYVNHLRLTWQRHLNTGDPAPQIEAQHPQVVRGRTSSARRHSSRPQARGDTPEAPRRLCCQNRNYRFKQKPMEIMPPLPSRGLMEGRAIGHDASAPYNT